VYITGTRGVLRQIIIHLDDFTFPVFEHFCYSGLHLLDVLKQPVAYALSYGLPLALDRIQFRCVRSDYEKELFLKVKSFDKGG